MLPSLEIGVRVLHKVLTAPHGGYGILLTHLLLFEFYLSEKKRSNTVIDRTCTCTLLPEAQIAYLDTTSATC